MKMSKKILICCEESQEICKAFRERGFEAYSNDIVECSGGRSEWHLRMDCMKAIHIKKWDLIISHPPCTFLSVASAVWLFRGGKLDEARYEKGILAKNFFLSLLNADCSHVAVENPTPLKIFQLPNPSQIIQPFEYGDPYRKRTALWLRGLPKLVSTNIVHDNIQLWVDGGRSLRAKNGLHRSQRYRSKTFPGIAAAMAEQWGNYLLQEL